MTQTQTKGIVMRESDTLEGLATALAATIYEHPVQINGQANMYAQELHVIDGVIYMLTTLGPGSWTRVQSCVMKCDGDPTDPAAWEAPRPVLRADRTILSHGGISLDMTYFCVGGVHYAMWSGRWIVEHEPNIVAKTANVYIATIDPRAPWNLTSEPVEIVRPIYGWDRCESEVDEGPAFIRRGDDLFVTIAGGSTACPDLYCIGLLHAKAGSNLLSKEAWDWLPYPVLTKESVPGQFGPGHNSFFTDPETGDDLLVYHAVLHDAAGVGLGRHMAIRRIHWAASGYPVSGDDARP